MAACGSLRQFFDKPLPESSSLLDSLSSWNQIKNIKPVESSFTEIFGELHFHEKSESPPPPPPPPSPTHGKKPPLDPPPGAPRRQCSSDSMQLCTEGLGFESLGDVEDLLKDSSDDWDECRENQSPDGCSGSWSDVRRKRSGNGGKFPPPISTIGRNGKPWVYFKSYRNDGRIVLKEIRIPTQELLRASREHGRLKLQFVHPDDTIDEGDDQEEEHDEDDGLGRDLN